MNRKQKMELDRKYEEEKQNRRFLTQEEVDALSPEEIEEAKVNGAMLGFFEALIDGNPEEAYMCIGVLRNAGVPDLPYYYGTLKQYKKDYLGALEEYKRIDVESEKYDIVAQNIERIAYQCNDLEQLKELDLLISVTLAGLSEQKATLDIPDVEEKIKKLEWEIREIRSKDPYQYKNLFSKPELVKEKHLDLQQQAEEYRQYSAQLDEKLSMILPEGSFLFWSDEWWGEA